ncbi:MAG: alpha/beta-hydrolase [Monoraphidium minutum]|nr:MAG: alpha/beta-hydrolase [Monoraphidium minutum]
MAGLRLERDKAGVERPTPAADEAAAAAPPAPEPTSAAVGAATAGAPPPRAAPAPAAPAADRATRPLIPQLDLAALAASLLSDGADDDGTVADNLVTDDGPPRLFTPYLPAARRVGGREVDPQALPVMFYLPGIDGTGLAAQQQFPRLLASFDMRCLVIPPSDRSTFEELLGAVEALLRREIEADGRGRPVYLLGESFGGLLALALAERLGELVDRLVLVNPATSFAQTPWPQAGPLLTSLPPEVYRLLPFALSPVLCDPLAMARHAVDGRAPLERQASDYLYGLLDLMPQLGALKTVLPPQTLAWRLELLRQGCEFVQPRLKDVKQRTLVLAGERDLLIPSAEEAERLSKKLPRCRKAVLPGRSHALLQEEGVDLVQILQTQGFYVTERVLSNGTASTSARGGGGAAFGSAAPVQLPTAVEIAADRGGFVSTIRRLCSPVYYSTMPDGSVVQGWGGVPRHAPGAPPLLFIANHQLFAADMYTMIPDMLEATGILPRGLAHPAVFAGPDAFRSAPPPDAAATAAAPAGNTPFSLFGGGGGGGGGGEGDGGGQANFASLLSTYGAVPVSAFAMHRLLANGDSVLLYPGGAREAFKRKGEAYQLIWPEKEEFVRMAAKFGATIVPISAVGADEGVTQLLDIGEVAALQRQLPSWLGGRDPDAAASRIPAARRGVNATMADTESFGLPLIAPAVPKRFYFLFGAPIETTPALASDREACQRLYRGVKGAVEGGMGYLLRKREADPYRELLPRLAYEASWGGGRQAPSFKP